MAFLSLAAVQLTMSSHQIYADTKSGKSLVNAVAGNVTPNTELFAVRYYDQSLPFYFGRSLTLVDYRDEFSMGLDIEPGKGIANLPEFVAIWRSRNDVLAVLQRPVYEQLLAQGLKAKIVYEDPRRMVIGRHSSP